MGTLKYRWGNPWHERMLMWLLRTPSPTLGRPPTFWEAWTGDLGEDVL